MTTKKARKGYPRQYNVWGEYKLSSTEEEDYILEIKKAADYELWDTFLEQEKENKMDIGFYFEMANFFFKKGKADKAQELMYNAIELCRGSSEGLRLAAYMYESWKQFDKAIAVYTGILSQDGNDLITKRDLALAYFQNKNFEAAVKTYYSVLTAPDEYGYNSKLKANALAEMNAILAFHKNEFDISYINQNLVKLLPVDLRITLESTYNYIANAQFIEPGKAVCNAKSQNSMSGGRYTGNDHYSYNYDLGEYAIKKAVPGNYRIKVDAYNSSSYAAQIPTFVRVIVFKNFQKENMELDIKIFDLDNQYGVIELDEITW